MGCKTCGAKMPGAHRPPLLDPDGVGDSGHKIKSANEKLGLPRGKIEKVYCLFDVDGTLRNNETDDFVPNERIRALLIILSSFKNVHIHVWSGSGELYARQAARALAITKYVKSYSGKAEHLELREKWGGRMVAIDDIQDTAIGDINLIVNEK